MRAGGTEMLSCEVTEELVPFTRWERDGRAVELDGRVIQLPSGALVISNTSQSDAGLYYCTIDGLGPAKSTEEAELQVSAGTDTHTVCCDCKRFKTVILTHLKYKYVMKYIFAQ